MAGAIKGITVEIGADTSKLSKALRSASAPVNKLKGELKSVEALLKMNPGNADLIRQKQALLAQSVEKVEGNLKQMKAALDAAKDSGATEKNSAAFRKLQQEIIKTENELKQLRAESARMSILSSGVAQATAKMEALGAKATAIGQKLKGVSVAAGLIGTVAVATVSEFDSAMSKVQAISGATGSDFQALRDKAREMGESTKFTATESAEALNYMAMAGWKTKDMLNGLEGIMYLAAASGEDLATTSDIVTDALTAMGYAAKDSGRLADVMAAASSNANTNVGMMGETFKYAAAVAGAMGYSMEDVALATGLMANAGIKASQAGTSLRSIISRMAAPTSAVAGELKKLGVSITDSSGKARPFRDVLSDLRTAMAGMSETEKTAAANTIAGKNAMSGFLALINASDKDFNKLANAIDNSDGAAQRMADTMIDNFGGQITILKSALQELAISMGDTLVPTLRQIVSAVQAVVTWFNGLSNGTKTLITKLVVFIGLLSPMLLTFGVVTKAVNMSVMAFANLAGKLVPVTAAANKAKAAITALRAAHAAEAARVSTCTALYGSNAAALYGVSSANRAAATSSKVLAKAQGVLNAVLSLGPWKLIAIAIGAATVAMGIFLATNEDARNKLVDIFNTIKDKAITVFEALPGVFETIVSTLSTVLPQIATAAAAAIPQIVNALANGMPEMVAMGTETLLSLIDGFTAAIPGLIASATQIIISLMNAFGQNVTPMITTGLEIVMALIDGLLQALPSLINGATSLITAIIDGITKAMPQIIAAAIAIAIALAEGLIKSIPQIIAAIPQIIAAILKAIITLAASLISAGKEIIVALAKGIKSNGSKIASTLMTYVKTLPKKIAAIAGAMLSAGAKIISSLIKGIKNMISGVVSAVTSIANKIKNKIKGISLVSIGKSIMSGLARGIRSGLSACISAASSVARSIINKFKSALKINSPSKIMRDVVGMAIPEGMAKGMVKGSYMVKRAAGALSTAAVVSSQAGAVSANKNNAVTNTTYKTVDSGTTYSFGNITLEVSSLEDATTVEDIANIFRRAKAFA